MIKELRTDIYFLVLGKKNATCGSTTILSPFKKICSITFLSVMRQLEANDLGDNNIVLMNPEDMINKHVNLVHYSLLFTNHCFFPPPQFCLFRSFFCFSRFYSICHFENFSPLFFDSPVSQQDSLDRLLPKLHYH